MRLLLAVFLSFGGTQAFAEFPKMICTGSLQKNMGGDEAQNNIQINTQVQFSSTEKSIVIAQIQEQSYRLRMDGDANGGVKVFFERLKNGNYEVMQREEISGHADEIRFVSKDFNAEADLRCTRMVTGGAAQRFQSDASFVCTTVATEKGATAPVKSTKYVVFATVEGYVIDTLAEKVNSYSIRMGARDKGAAEVWVEDVFLRQGTTSTISIPASMKQIDIPFNLTEVSGNTHCERI